MLSVPRPTDLSGLVLDDGETVARLPNRTVEGRVALSTDPGAVGRWVDPPVLGLRGRLELANSGETIRLRRGPVTVDSVRYDDAPEGEVYERAEGGWRWRPLGATDFPVVRGAGGAARLFVLPDARDAPIEALSAARERILLAGYSFTSRRVARTLCAVRDRGARVRVLIDGEPVGGLTRRSARVLDRLAACGVDVRALDGGRYAFHHAKYAVVDDRALVLTENWKPAGTGGRSSRGWGAIIESPAVAATLARTFRADAGFRDARPWKRYREDRELVTAPAARGRYPSRFSPRTVDIEGADLIVAPDNTEAAVIAELDAATESIRVQQVTIDPGHPFLRAVLRAARRGVRVRVLLSGAWYAWEENRALAERLRERAAHEGLPLAVRLVDPRSRFEKTHVKGVVVDGEAVILGSPNWTNASIRENREIAVVLRGEAAARYYTRVFRADWRGGVWRLWVGLAVAAALAGAAGAWVGRRRLRFA